MDDVSEFLSQYRELQEAIKQNDAELKSVHSVRIARYGDAPHTHSNEGNDDTLRTVLKAEKLESRAIWLRRQAMTAYDEIHAAIDRLEDPITFDIMHRYYILCDKRKTIAEETGYTLGWIDARLKRGRMQIQKDMKKAP